MSQPAALPSLDILGRRATIRINRPAQHNRLEIADLVAIHDMLGALEARDDIRVLVLTASGPSFSSGFDTNALTGPTPPVLRLDHVVDQLEALPIPTICALNGSVFGGSTDLALACDFRIGIEGMKVMVPAARIGMLYYPTGLRRAVSRLGVAMTKRMFLLGETFDTAALVAAGFLDRVAPADGFAAAVDTLADTIAANAPIAVRGMKRTIDGLARGDLDMAAAQRGYEASFGSAELAEGLRAMAEKRKPVFD